MFENVQGYYHIIAILLAPQNLVKFFFFFLKNNFVKFYSLDKFLIRFYLLFLL